MMIKITEGYKRLTLPDGWCIDVLENIDIDLSDLVLQYMVEIEKEEKQLDEEGNEIIVKTKTRVLPKENIDFYSDAIRLKYFDCIDYKEINNG